MADRSVEHWHPSAAYLYVLHLDGPSLAWEYLRRNPDYRHDWLHHRRSPDAAQRWGLRALEDPSLDARDAYPTWFPDHASVIQLHPDADPPPGAVAFAFWRLAGYKHLIHDGQRLTLTIHRPGRRLRFVLAPGLEDGMAFVHAVRSGATSSLPHLAASLSFVTDNASLATVLGRPSANALLELHTLQALDATLAGASLRSTAEGLFGGATVAADWHADSALRARVRRLTRRGKALMRGGYRELAQLPQTAQGRAAPRSNVPAQEPLVS